METIKIEDIPLVLQQSKLAQQFDDEISIPKKYIIRNLRINDDNFDDVMESLRYFMVENLPWEIYDYVLSYKNNNTILSKDEQKERKANYKKVDNPLFTISDYEPNLLKYYDFFFEEFEVIIQYKKYMTNFFTFRELRHFVENREPIVGIGPETKKAREAREKEAPYPYSPISDAFSIGSLNLGRYFHYTLSTMHNEPFEVEIKNHKNEILKMNKDLDDIKHWVPIGFSWYTIFAAIDYNHLDCLKYTFKYGRNVDGCKTDDWFDGMIEGTAGDGYLDCMKYLLENGCPWGTEAFNSAASHGNLNCLKYLNEFFLDKFSNVNIEKTSEQYSESTSICKWKKLNIVHDTAYSALHNYKSSRGKYKEYINSFTWEIDTILRAMGVYWSLFSGLHYYDDCDDEDDGFKYTNDNFECIKYAHQNGCPLHSVTKSKCNLLLVCIRCDNIECLKYFCKNMKNCKCVYCLKDNKQYFYEDCKQRIEEIYSRALCSSNDQIIDIIKKESKQFSEICLE